MPVLPLPDYTPVYTPTKTVKPRQRAAKLPSWGIEQRGTQGQNQTAPEWSVKWILTPAEANTLDFFLSEQAKTGAEFFWSPPYAPLARFRCDDWTKQPSSRHIWEVQATFRQVFNFALPRLSARTGYFALSGSATLTRGRLLLLSPGTFALTGNAATFTKGYPLLAAPGVFTLSGLAASTTKSWQLSSDAGVFTLEGGTVSTPRSLLLLADTGAITLTMQPATLTYAPPSAGTDYYGDWTTQTYGFEADIYPSWWAS
jgi:phage-related protein